MPKAIIVIMQKECPIAQLNANSKRKRETEDDSEIIFTINAVAVFGKDLCICHFIDLICGTLW